MYFRYDHNRKFLMHVETLRKYPPATVLTRQASSNYTFHGTQINIPKGLIIVIPSYAIH